MATEQLQTENEPAGIVTIQGRTYHVYRVVAGVLQSGTELAVLVGHRGARYLLIDNGPRYRLSVWNVTGERTGWAGNFPTSHPWRRTGGFPNEAEQDVRRIVRGEG